MKLLFSEQNSDYEHYQFPYAIWAVPEAGETPADIFNAGFLPSSRNLDRFYLCRQVRVNLAKFKPSSENRRILRKGDGHRRETRAARQIRLHAGTPPVFQDLRRHQIRQGRDDVRAARRAVRLAHHFASARVHGHARPAKEIGVATLYLEGKALAFYYYAFYDLNYYARNLGMFMMTSAVALFAERGFKHLYLGTCYSQNGALQDAVRRRGIFQRLPLVGRSGRTEIHHQARQEGTGPAPAGNRGIPRGILQGRPGQNHRRQRVSGEGEVNGGSCPRISPINANWK